MMQGKGGMGHAKHRKSGVVPVNTRAKILRAIEANKPKPQRRRQNDMKSSVREVFSPKGQSFEK